MKALLAILITVFCFALLLGLLSIRSREDRVMTERLNYFAGGEQAQRQKQKLTPKALLYNCIEGIANGLGRLQQGKRIELMMQQADWPIRGTEFEAILLLWGGLVGLVTFLVTLKGAMFFVGALVGILMGLALLGLRIRRRRKKFTNQLGDMLTMVAKWMPRWAARSSLSSMRSTSATPSSPHSTTCSAASPAPTSSSSSPPCSSRDKSAAISPASSIRSARRLQSESGCAERS